MRCLLSAYRNAYMCLHDGRLEGVAASQHHHQVGDENGRSNVNNSSTSVTRRLFSQVDRLFEGSTEERERALELLKAKEQQVNPSSLMFT